MTRAAQVLTRVVDAAESDGFAAHGVHVLCGDAAASHLWDADVRRDVHSIAKGVCVIAAGMASDAGLFDIDAPVVSYLGGRQVGTGVEDVTTRHLLGMTSGIDFPWSETMMTDWPDLADEFLSRPTSGRRFQYSAASTYTAMRALATVVGDVGEWLVPRLFDPLGIADPPWDRCSLGHVRAADGLHLGVFELARLGQLIRDDGRWEGRMLVSAQWPGAMHARWSSHDAAPAYRRYALAGWGGPGRAWRLHGAHGQLLIFLDDAVVTLTAQDHFGADLMAEHVVQILDAP